MRKMFRRTGGSNGSEKFKARESADKGSNPCRDKSEVGADHLLQYYRLNFIERLMDHLRMLRINGRGE